MVKNGTGDLGSHTSVNAAFSPFDQKGTGA